MLAGCVTAILMFNKTLNQSHVTPISLDKDDVVPNTEQVKEKSTTAGPETEVKSTTLPPLNLEKSTTLPPLILNPNPPLLQNPKQVGIFEFIISDTANIQGSFILWCQVQSSETFSGRVSAFCQT